MYYTNLFLLRLTVIETLSTSPCAPQSVGKNQYLLLWAPASLMPSYTYRSPEKEVTCPHVTQETARLGGQEVPVPEPQSPGLSIRPPSPAAWSPPPRSGAPSSAHVVFLSGHGIAGPLGGSTDRGCGVSSSRAAWSLRAGAPVRQGAQRDPTKRLGDKASGEAERGPRRFWAPTPPAQPQNGTESRFCWGENTSGFCRMGEEIGRAHV